ncbi:hypothetical protein [Bacteroides thetaiotaomicron]|uniref:hypothetical protein n=1 Tax=Bacteroides thetaiotaomicron TaxID=818 RepID=UPI0021654641|nr:hypothetical protein [Bacteroides thetaiotaomicron]MCS2294172.1 hypothetical protein [Bacteroides thetaiotaomicron]
MELEGKTAGRTRLFTKWFPIRFVRMAGFYKRSGAAKRKSYKKKMEVRLKWVIPFQPVDDICPRCH